MITNIIVLCFYSHNKHPEASSKKTADFIDFHAITPRDNLSLAAKIDLRLLPT